MTATVTGSIAAPRPEDLSSDRAVHLAGVGGSAMSGVAVLLRQHGIPVVGTDPNPDDEVRRRLERCGVSVHVVQDGSQIRSDTQLVVASAALPWDHPELEQARRKGIPVLKYAELLGALVNHAEGIAVAGTHGKTTTTAMVVWILKQAGVDPGFIVGGHVPQLAASAGAGHSQVFVAEACEYDRSFLNLTPQRAIITNIDNDHLDIYGDLNGVQEAFSDFACRIRPKGAIVYPQDDHVVEWAIQRASCRRISFSTRSAADWEARNIGESGTGVTFKLVHRNSSVADMSLRLPGLHNVHNALAALAVCADAGLPLESLVRGLTTFAGVGRRFELKGEVGGITVIDDYAHHPTAIKALLEAAAMRFAGRRLAVVFQPHQILRTRLLERDFATAFGRAGLLVVTDIYSARDRVANREDLSAMQLVVRIRETGMKVEHISDFPTTVDFLMPRLRPGDVLLTVGAGDIHKIADELLRRIAQQ